MSFLWLLLSIIFSCAGYAAPSPKCEKWFSEKLSPGEADCLHKEGNLTESRLEKETLESIRNRTLVVLEPRGGGKK